MAGQKHPGGSIWLGSESGSLFSRAPGSLREAGEGGMSPAVKGRGEFPHGLVLWPLVNNVVILILGGSTVNNPPAMQETWVLSLAQQDPLEKVWQPTPVFLPIESYRQKSLAGYSPWGCKESDTTEQLNNHTTTS